MAVQGGLLAGALAQMSNVQYSMFNKILGTVSFLVSKLVAYTILGFLLGWVGSRVQLSLTGQGVLQMLVAVYMLGVGAALLDVHPFFRHFILQPPRFLTRWIRGQSKSGDLFAPAILGAATVFVPCGTTQAMMALAVGSGNPGWGAAIMGVFVLGTSPVFLGLGLAMARLGQKVMKVTAWAVVAMAIWTLNTAGVMLGSPISIQSALAKAECVISFCSPVGESGQAADQVTVGISRAGYSVSNAVRAGKEIKMTLTNTDGRGCQQAVNIPALGISKVIRPGQREEISFKAPDKPGKLQVTCSMGMFTGELQVI
ncbi:MAG: Uncharacterized protein G01um101416_1233 [Microgenomates group bacterium Gr01-1014_16]|nr:MAG: Uncharacterized protein G01um101416_1233 [Microgenomates group bacterium Gr01-1014_16]